MRSCNTGHAISSVQKGIVNTRTEVDRRLEEGRDDYRTPAMRPHPSTARSERNEQHRDRDRRPMHVEGERMRVHQRRLHHDPVEAPHERQQRERDVRSAARVHAQNRHSGQPSRNGSTCAAAAAG